MAQLSAKARADTRIDVAVPEAPPLAPAELAIDRAHLARMTHSERDLERELLELFTAQIDLLLGRMGDAGPAVIGAHAHTLAGSSRGVGAWKMADAAAAVEAAAAEGRDPAAAVERLKAAAREAQVEIADLIRA